MELYILLECFSQSDYTEPRYWIPAYDSNQVVGVYSTMEKAEAEMVRLKARLRYAEFDEDEERIYYDIETVTLNVTGKYWAEK